MAVILIIFATSIVWIIWGNTALELNTYTISSEKIPDSFEGYRIAHISDLHNDEFGEDNEKLVGMLKRAEPDLIAITGDLIDSYHTDIQVAIDFVNQAVEIAPTYYVTGNHEARIAEYVDVEKAMLEAGVVVLKNESLLLEKEGESIVVFGVSDPSFQTDYMFGDDESVADAVLQELLNAQKTLEYSDAFGQEVSEQPLVRDTYKILLSHRPELFDVYVANDMNLVLSGHAHGGQFRLPFIGGIVAPNQGFFPEYDGGLYTEESTNMIVSRGIGNSLFPVRFNNRPEVILIILEK